MNMQTSIEEYTLALKQGQKEYRERLAEGKSPYPAVLDELLPDELPPLELPDEPDDLF